MRRAIVTLWLLLSACGCGRTGEIVACHIADRECQRDVYYDVVRLRGDGFDPFAGLPPIRTLSLAAYRAELVKEQEAQQESAKKAAKPPTVDPWNGALQLLGLVTPTQSVQQASVDDRVQNVAAFYSSSTREVTVIDRGDTRDDESDTVLLAHELVHAFQDRERSGDRKTHSTDSFFASQNFIEGEATLYEHLARAEIEGLKPQEVHWERYYGNWAAGLRKDLAQQNSPFYAVSWFVYPIGGDYLTRAYLRGGNAAVRRLSNDFPNTGRALMASLVNVKPAEPQPLQCHSDAPSSAYSLAGYDRFGAMQLYGFLASLGVEDTFAWNTSLAWRDDAIWVYFDAKQMSVAVAWRVHMASESAAQTLETAALGTSDRTLIVERFGRDVLIRAADDTEIDGAWKTPADCTP